ncbi:hypothetical protein [Sphingomonas corticis]|uniref:3'-5' exonuclease n=1 Tax=Sphingomonas corticis TaxID=2722791 RepID=A0ABX1CVR2_9SPHN|nr:hypothetical protein [Sphingomonas corticis]NJR80060.1 hypothetical protein [Sphingomonas corticis]
MSASAGAGAGESKRVLVLDVECGVSAEAVALLPNGDAAGIDRRFLQELTAVAMLSFVVADDGLSCIELSGSLVEGDEREALLRIDAALRGLGAGGVLVTHNGVAHDLPLCLRRCLANWMFGCQAVREWVDADPHRHVDTLLRCGGGRGRAAGPALTDLCAALGIEAAVPARSSSRPVDARIRKGAVDVVRTALVYLHLEAMARGDGTWLATCWGDLAAHLLSGPVRADHLLPLARQGLRVAEAAGARA